MKLLKRLRSNWAKRFCANKPVNDDNSQQAQADEAVLAGCIGDERVEAVSTEKELTPEVSQLSEEHEEYEEHPQEDLASKVRGSGLCFQQVYRKPFDCHYFEFLCWLPRAVKKQVNRAKGNQCQIETENSEESGDENEKADEEEREEEGEFAVRDAGVCIVKVIPKKPDNESENATGKDEARLMVEVTTSEWKMIQTLRKAAEEAPRGDETPNVLDKENKEN